MTNDHVVEGATAIRVTVSSTGATCSAVGAGHSADAAISLAASPSA